jgi:hypothetical protein
MSLPSSADVALRLRPAQARRLLGAHVTWMIQLAGVEVEHHCLPGLELVDQGRLGLVASTCSATNARDHGKD